MKSFLVYKFTCASCSSSYIGETCRHFKTRIEEHIKKDNKSHIFKYLHSTATCFDSYNSLCFKITNSKFDLKGKEALHINGRKTLTGEKLKCTRKSFSSLPFTVASVPSLLFHLCLFVFAFLFHLLFSLFLTLIISIFYCFNHTSLLLHLMTNTWHQIYLFHLLFSLLLRELLASFTVLITLRYYFISL